jgi:glutamine cyclotransferase
MRDGSNKLYTINPDSFQEEKEIEVYDNKGPVEKLNELEYINGKIYANVWMTDRIVIINPNTGVVEGDIYLPNLLSAREKSQLASKECVLNGIAYDNKTKRIFITGKKWPKLFHISIK